MSVLRFTWQTENTRGVGVPGLDGARDLLGPEDGSILPIGLGEERKTSRELHRGADPSVYGYEMDVGTRWWIGRTACSAC